jgi:hypothetical protein
MARMCSAVLNISISSLAGISSTAIFQRFNDLFFYSIFLGIFISSMSSLLLFRFTKGNFHVAKILRPYVLVITVLLSFSFLSTLPLTIDRSYSVWLLKHVAEAEMTGHIVDQTNLSADSVNFFSITNGQLSRRIDEQKQIGNFEETTQGVIKITHRGMILARLNNLIGIIFGLEPKYSRLETP